MWVIGRKILYLCGIEAVLEFKNYENAIQVLWVVGDNKYKQINGRDERLVVCSWWG